MSVAWNLPAENQSGEFRSSSTHPTHLSGTGRSGNVATLQRALYQIKHVGATRSISVEYEVVISGWFVCSCCYFEGGHYPRLRSDPGGIYTTGSRAPVHRGGTGRGPGWSCSIPARCRCNPPWIRWRWWDRRGNRPCSLRSGSAVARTVLSPPIESLNRHQESAEALLEANIEIITHPECTRISGWRRTRRRGSGTLRGPGRRIRGCSRRRPCRCGPLRCRQPLGRRCTWRWRSRCREARTELRKIWMKNGQWKNASVDIHPIGWMGGAYLWCRRGCRVSSCLSCTGRFGCFRCWGCSPCCKWLGGRRRCCRRCSGSCPVWRCRWRRWAPRSAACTSWDSLSGPTRKFTAGLTWHHDDGTSNNNYYHNNINNNNNNNINNEEEEKKMIKKKNHDPTDQLIELT